MAVGVDEIAHKTALKYNSETIAVLGSGFGDIYPKENEDLFHNIIENNGLVITEYKYNCKANSSNFPKRNRIVSAISEGILVVEAAYRSGTSITVNYAKEQGKRVFAIPGRLDDCHGIGVNRMIKEGAILTTQIEDIINSYPQFINKKRKTFSKIKNIDIKVKKEYKEIYNILKDNVLTVDEILAKVENKNINNIMNKLINMELEELIVQVNGVEYKLKN